MTSHLVHPTMRLCDPGTSESRSRLVSEVRDLEISCEWDSGRFPAPGCQPVGLSNCYEHCPIVARFHNISVLSNVLGNEAPFPIWSDVHQEFDI